METVERSAAINQYPSISLSGNPRAIIGNVYGLDHEVVHASTHVERRTPRLKSLQVQFRGEQENLAMVFTGFPVLLLQDYEEVKSSINLLRDFDKEIEKCAKHIGVRHALFRQSLKEFLGSHIGLDVAQQMLSDLHHPTWADDIFKQHVQERHGSNMSAIQHALDLISISLEGIMSFSERCALLRDGAPKVSILSSDPPLSITSASTTSGGQPGIGHITITSLRPPPKCNGAMDRMLF